MWEREELPKEAIIAVLYKGKGDVHDPNNTRGLSLLNTGLKVLSNVVLNRLQPHAERVIGEYQAGFRKGRSCMDHIHTLRLYLAARLEHQLDTHLIFVDFQKAYDTVIREVLWERMKEMGIPHKLIRVAQVMSRCTRNRVRALGKLFQDFITTSGVRQGDALSPLLFNLALESAIRRVCALLSHQVRILAYADDIVILGDNLDAVRNAVQLLAVECALIGLRINQGKTKYMLSTNSQGPTPAALQVGEQQYEAVDTFRYLGSIFTPNNAGEEDVKARIRQGWGCFAKLRNIMRSKKASYQAKLTIYLTVIRPVVLYGCQAWVLSPSCIQRLQGFENRMLRAIVGPEVRDGLVYYRSNLEVQRILGCPDNIVRAVQAAALHWTGHILRFPPERILRQVLEDEPEGRRRRGRPRDRWWDAIEQLAELYLCHDWKELAHNWKEWKKFATFVKKNPPPPSGPHT